MMRSLFSGVAGLKTHQTKMDVIGNNIANVNTVAYKSQNVTFQELMYQTTQSASAANAATGRGGINAKQIGLGVSTGAINANISTSGASQTTGNPFDIQIKGDSFFIVSDGASNYFTRAGAFYVDGMGNLAMTSNGYTVMGWQPDPNDEKAIIKDTVTPLKIMSAENMISDPAQTTQTYLSGVIDKNSTQLSSENGLIVNIGLYDSLGYSYIAKLSIKELDPRVEGKYSIEPLDLIDSDGISLMHGVDEEGYDKNGFNLVDEKTGKQKYTLPTVLSIASPAEHYLTYNLKTGANTNEDSFKLQVLKATSYTPPTPDVYTPATVAAGTDLDAADPPYYVKDGTGYKKATGTSVDGGEYYTKTEGTPAKTETGGKADAFATDIEMKTDTSTMFDNKGTSTIKGNAGDYEGRDAGRKVGEMSGVAIAQDGKITATYDNGTSKLLGQIAVANFSNPSGLEKKGDNLYQSTPNSGAFDGIGDDITSGSGAMSTGVLEMSNVDLSAEFTDMITTQRGFQANSRIITVSDSMLEELTNLKR